MPESLAVMLTFKILGGHWYIPVMIAALREGILLVHSFKASFSLLAAASDIIIVIII